MRKRTLWVVPFLLIGCGASVPDSATSPGGAGLAAIGRVDAGLASCSNDGVVRRLEAAARKGFADLHFAGMSVAVLKGDRVFWTGAYGLADVALGVPVTVETPFYVASATKPLTASALMQLYEKGLFGLDEDVNAYLPFPVRNPGFPDVPITFRQLLRHRSSIVDNWDFMPYYPDADSRVPLGEYLQSYFVPGGSRYDAALNFGTWAPGADFAYSNMGADLYGYLVEVLSGEQYERYMQRHVLGPIDMSGVWFIRDFDELAVAPAVPTQYDFAAGAFVPFGHYGVDGFTSGTLRTDVLSYSRFLLTHMNGGRLEPWPRLLEPSTVDLMHGLPDGETMGYALGFFRNDRSIFGGPLIGHDGGDLGAFSWAYYVGETGVGVVLFANSEWTGLDYSPWRHMLEQLYAEGAKIRACEVEGREP